MEDFKSWNEGCAKAFNNPIDKNPPRVTLIDKGDYFVVSEQWLGRGSETPFKTLEEAKRYMEAL